MSQNRTQRSLKNAKWGIILQFVTIFTNMAVRTVFLRTLGVSLNGLNGLMTEVVAILSMAEMGFGTAVTYSLYKPLADKDEDAINRLMGLFHKAYIAIGGVLVLLGIIVMPFIQHIVTDVDFSISYIRLIFGMFILHTASSYLFSYKRTLFNADQKNFVINMFTIAQNIATAAIAILILLLTKNYILYLALLIVVTVAVNILISIYADKKYPFLRRKPMPASAEEKQVIFKNIRHLFVGQVSGKITTSTDNILISILVSTYQIGIYSNYTMINNAVYGLFRKISLGMSASMGNLFATSGKNRVNVAYGRMEFVFGSASFAVALMMYAAITPFIKLWLGKDFVLAENVLFIVMINQFLFIAREPLWNMCNAAGLFNIDKYISILGSTVNLLVSIVLGRMLGMLGIFIGTTCTLVIQIILKEWFLYKKKLELSPAKALCSWVLRSALLVCCMLALRYIDTLLTFDNVIAELAARLGASGLLALAVLLVVYGRTANFAYFLEMLLGKFKPKKNM